MLDTEQINDLHRLYWSERWSIRKIERHLKMGWRTIRKYLEAQGPAARSRSNPRPLTSGLGSDMHATTRVMPAAITASTHGGVRP